MLRSSKFIKFQFFDSTVIILNGMIISKSIMLCCLIACGNIAARIVLLIEINKDNIYSTF
jgi:hypothetical protein